MTPVSTMRPTITSLRFCMRGALLCVGILLNATAQAQEPDKVIQVCAAKGHVFHQMVTDTITEAYRRIGYKAEFTWLPTRRSLIEANAGSCGAEMMRISGISRQFRNLMPVQVPIAQLEGVAFMVNKGDQSAPPIHEWSDLKDLRTYIIMGELYAEQGTRDMIVGQVRTYQQLFDMLKKGHIDVGVGVREVGLVEIARNYPHVGIEVTGTSLARSFMYHYVHTDNLSLVEKLEHVFRDMALKGEVNTLNARALERLSKPN